MQEADVERNGLSKRIKEKDKKIGVLESKITDLEEDKLSHFNEYQSELEAQKNISERQIVDLKKRIDELTEKCEKMKQQS